MAAGRCILSLLLAAVLALAAALPVAARTGDAAVLVADAIRVSPDRSLVAEGNVEVLYRGRRLHARRIIYSARDDRLTIEGPLSLTEGAETVLLADAAELSADFRDGILIGARLVLNRQLQIAAAEIARIGGRYTRMGPSLATACRICAESDTPLWEIRAARVLHDAEARRIYFDRAEFRLAGVPLIYLPRLDVPDPTQDRATGFLTPEFRASRALGAGVRLPYFIVLSEDRDLLVTPYASAGGAFAVETRYRQAFHSGALSVTLGLARDRRRPGRTRAWIEGDGSFALGSSTTLSGQLQAVGDRQVLDDHGQGSPEVLETNLQVTQITRHRLARARLTQFRSLRTGDTNAELPNSIADARFEQRFALPGDAGAATITFDGLVAQRRSGADILGRDLARASLRADWQRDWTLAGGLRAGLRAQLQFDHANIRQDSNFPAQQSRFSPVAAVELRWPLAGAERGGAVHIVEPVAQLVLAPRNPAALPNEDSRLVEFDEASLFALHRHPGFDGREAGRRANLGIGWTRHDPAGWSFGVTLGRVLRDPAAPVGQFSALSGLDGVRSHWLASVHMGTDDGMRLAGRALFDGRRDLTKAEVLFGWTTDRADLSTGFTHLRADPGENRPDRSSELGIDAAWRITPQWTALADLRYDIASGRTARAGVGARFRNECLAVDVSLSRRQASSTSVAPLVDFGLRVDLIGFGSGPAPGSARRCVGGVSGG